MANILEKFGIKDASSLYFKNKRTHNYDLFMDFANEISLEVQSDSVSALGKGQEILTWNLPKTATLTVNGQIANFGLLSILFGSKGIEQGGDVFKADDYEYSAGREFTLSELPKANTLGVVKVLEDGSLGKAFKVVSGSTPKTGEVAVSGQTCKFFVGDLNTGEKVRACYLTTKATGNYTFTVSSLSQGDSYEIYGDTMVKYVSTGENKFLQLHIFNASIEQSTSLTFSAENPSDISISMKVMADSTRLDVEGNPKMFDFIVLE